MFEFDFLEATYTSITTTPVGGSASRGLRLIPGRSAETAPTGGETPRLGARREYA